MKRSEVVEQLRALARYKTHGGYVWAAVMADGELVCVPCVRENYKTILRATAGKLRDRNWQCIGLAHSSESEAIYENCAHCNTVIWENQ